MASPRFSLSLSCAVLAGVGSLILGVPMATAQPAAESVDSLLATADTTAGQRTGRICMSCHTINKGGATRIGPNLWNIVNRPVGQVTGFHYSAAFKKITAKTWSYDSLNTWLYSPPSEAPGTAMAYGGIKKTQDRANVIAWLRTLSDSPAPLPKIK
ncbi:cytochrome c family protein [Asticcacaulis sp. EMRT-3]|uniref:c-type cytochrome n=1 Tax=Asticcacaulis sp. EMRT-3 TaxID=3040349 RepID=UPI0024AF9AEE|nr:cytochrome c family protein [Asticcacaulis sp. EMRT-3]MDI7776268.1 cytochrome c family protein [Asticcacaulis sp. EMRT-3]